MKVFAVMLRILLQFRHDRRTLALLLFAPLFVLTLMSYVFNGSEYHPKIGIVNAPLQVVRQLEDQDATVIRYAEGRAMEALRSSEIDAVINYESGKPHIILEGSDPSKNAAVIRVVQSSLRPAAQAMEPDITYLYGYEGMSSFDNFGPILIGFFVFFFVFLISGVSFLGERTSGTLERILATPIRRWQLVAGYLLGFATVTIVQSALIAWFTIDILDMMMAGSFVLVLVITILTALVALTLGTFISAYANNELQMIQFIPIVIVPQVFFSGLFDLSTMAPLLQWFAKLMPLYYVADALRNIMIRGRGWEAIAFDALVLIGLCVVFTLMNVLALKKHRKI
jgi:ABC-2 type transport system permease protein